MIKIIKQKNNLIILENYQEACTGELIENARYLFSYGRCIAKLESGRVWLDVNYWDYSTTTGKHRNEFLGETKSETQEKIINGEYWLSRLN